MSTPVGIVSYGMYVPRYRITVEEIARVWGENAVNIKNGLRIHEKSVPDIDEDTITIGVEAGKHALTMAGLDSQQMGALFIGSESHPYAVKPSGTVVSDALNMGPDIMVADFEFACKAGTAALQCCYGLVKSGQIDYGMAIGADTAQGRPGDALEYTAAAGGAAYIVGKDPIVTLDKTYSYTTDTSDFWRREGQEYPRHGARFTGKPAYFNHVMTATKKLLGMMEMEPKDFKYAIFHMPNGKFPETAAKKLGFTKEQTEPGLIVKKIGNTYSGSSMLGFAATLDIASPGDKILVTSYGSGAGSDSFCFTVTDKITQMRGNTPKFEDFVQNKKNIDYATYARMRRKLKL